jgi:hypothetical protein
MEWTRQRRTDEVETKLEIPMVRLTGVNCYCLYTHYITLSADVLFAPAERCVKNTKLIKALVI